MDEEIDDIKTKLKCQGKVIDPMTYEMELNRIDFRNDVSSILDQIEKEFEINSVANMGTSLVSTSGHVDLSNLHLDTPPDSDSENNPQHLHANLDSDNLSHPEKNPTKLNKGGNLEIRVPQEGVKSLLSFDRLTKKIRLNELEDLELMDTSKSEIDRLLGDSQFQTSNINPANYPDAKEKALRKQSISVSRAKQNQLSTTQLNQTERVDQFHNDNESIRGKSGYDSKTANINNNDIKEHKLQNLEANKNSDQNKSSLNPKISSLTSATIKRKLLQCPTCSTSFTQLNDLQTHVDLNHITEISSTNSLDTKVAKKERSTANKNFRCSLCDKGFVQKSHLTRHMKIHGIDKKNGGANSSKQPCHPQEQFVCRICLKNCKNKVGLVRHRARHLACVQCSEVFNNKVSLQEHLLKTHTKNAVISIEQPLLSPSPPPLLDSPSESMTSLLFQEQTDMNESIFLSDMAQNDTIEMTIRTEIGPKDARLSIVSCPYGGSSSCKDSISEPNENTLESADVIRESFADISNSDYLESCNEQGLSDEFYPTDLF